VSTFKLVFGLLAVLAWAPSALAEPSPCRAVTHEGSDYTVCEVDLRREVVRFFWKRADGQPYGNPSALPQSLGGRSGHLLFATNAGMYDPDYRPVGLYVENGRELVRANTKAGPGNFHMRPNGVLYVSAESAGVLETGSFLKQKPRADFATQSGPMLVINGRLHPAQRIAKISNWRRQSGSEHVGVRHLRNRGFVRRVRALVPRQAAVQERTFLGRRKRPKSLFEGIGPEWQLAATGSHDRRI